MARAAPEPAWTDRGANLAWGGDAGGKCARADPGGGARWRLSGLWRGRRGTEAAIGTQTAGARFVLVQAAALAIIDLPPGSAGAVEILAEGPGDGTAAAATASITGISTVPPSPVHLAAEPRADGGIRLRWIRRSRTGWRWVDGVDAPLGEEREQYRITIETEAGTGIVRETAVPELMLDAAIAESATAAEVRQVGALGLSPPARIVLSISGES